MGNRAFKAHNGHFLSAEHDSVKLHHGHHADHHCKFHVESHGHDKVALRTHCGKYVSIGDHKQVYLSHHFHGEHSLYHLEHHHGKLCRGLYCYFLSLSLIPITNSVAIRGHHHHYISAHAHGHVHASHERDHHSLFDEIVC